MRRSTICSHALPLSAALALSVLGCNQKPAAAPTVSTAPVQRGAIEVTASADGVIEPIRKVEVKSKASGEVIELGADTGDQVTPGQTLVRLLPRDAQNSYDQAVAELEASEARLSNAQARLNRAERLHRDGLVTTSDLEIDQLAVTTARSEVVRVKKALDNAAERLQETTVRSPIAGTVIAKNVEVGQVVSSAVSQVSGGTLLLTLADLAEVQVRSLVDEVDIGKVRPGMPVALKVEAFADRQFSGTVLKIEPQAVVEQNVTMFPVLTRIENREGLLMPGMNAEVTVMVDRHENVLRVPNEAVKSFADVPQMAAYLGIERSEPGGQPGGNGGPGAPGANGREGERAGRRAPGGEERRVVFVRTADGKFELRPVTVGLRNWEQTEVLTGLQEGEEVALLPSASQLRQSAEFRERMQRMRGMPGMSGGGTGGSGGRRGGGS